MIPINITKKNGAIIGVDADDVLELAVNNEGVVLRTLPQRYYPLSSMALSDISPIIVSDKIILILETVCQALPLPYQYGHFEFVLTYNADFVNDGALSADILYKFESYKNDGWFLESTNIYTFPEAGYQASSATSKFNVKTIAWNLDLDLTKELYFFFRVRGATLSGGVLILSDVYSSWSGRRLFLYASTFSNTGEDRYCPMAIDLLPRISPYFGPWPGSKTIHYEVYVGESGTLTDYTSGDVEPLVFKNSATNPTGFYFFDGAQIRTFDDDGVPSANYGNKMFFITPPVDTKKALFAIYRANWIGGSTGWIAKSTQPQDVVVSNPRNFSPSSRLQILSNTFPSDYHLHIIIGTSPVLADYFLGGDTEDFSKILPAYSGLIDYSTTLNAPDRARFEYYYSGKIINPGAPGFAFGSSVDVLYTSTQNYSGNDKLFIFWRAAY